MKHIFPALIFLLFSIQGFTQNIDFTLASPQPVIMEVRGGSLLPGDLDNDGDMDLMQSGIGIDINGLGARASVFLNDGNGNFSLEAVAYGSVYPDSTVQNFNQCSSTEGLLMSDLDNDGDLDIIITASNRTDLYRNNGQAQFVYDPNTSFPTSFLGDLIAGDVDGDGDNDVIHFGKTGSSSVDPYFALLFLNDGSGAFTQSNNITFEPFAYLNLEFIDLEGDGDLDILSFGSNENNEAQATIFENDGSGNYSIFSDSNIAPHKADKISVGDIDNDGDEDVLITGEGDGFMPKTALYINDGNGHFNELMDTPFPDIFAGSNGLADLDNDNDLDVLLIGSMAGGLPNIYSIVFENLGNNMFIASDSLAGEYIAVNTIADFNGDGKKDIIIQGHVDFTNIYWNQTLSTRVIAYPEMTLSVFPNPSNGQLQIDWGVGVFNRVEILDLNGRSLFTEKINRQGFHNMNLNLPSGVYILRMYGGESVSSQKFIIENDGIEK